MTRDELVAFLKERRTEWQQTSPPDETRDLFTYLADALAEHVLQLEEDGLGE